MNVYNIQTYCGIGKIISALFLIVLTTVSCVVKDEFETYNFVDKQNFEIDLNYDQIMGTDLYFYSNQTLFLVNILPESSLSISMKLYTNETELISAIENNKSLLFGFDFNITNLDPLFPNLRSDIFLCMLNKNKTECSDYAYDLKENKYIENSNGKLVKSKIFLYEYALILDNFLPLGFNSVKQKIFHENVIDYLAYYEVSLEKLYPDNFDRMGMFKWMDFTATYLKENVTGFYGFYDKQINEGLYKEDLFFSMTLVYKDGNGLSDNSFFNRISYITIFIYFIIVFMFN